jgi:hypothetical protein
VIVGDDVSIAVLGLVHLQVGVLPGKLLTRVNGLERPGNRESYRISTSVAFFSPNL